MASKNSANSSDEINAVQHNDPNQQENDGSPHQPSPASTAAIEVSLNMEESDLNDSAESTWIEAAYAKGDANNPIDISSSPSANTNNVIDLSSSLSGAEIQISDDSTATDLIPLISSSTDISNNFITFSSSYSDTTSNMITLTNTSAENETQHGLNDVAAENMQNNIASSSTAKNKTKKRKINSIVSSPPAHTRSKARRLTRSSTKKNNK